MRIIGLMSGTSYDAIDAVVADFRVDDDTVVITPRDMLSTPYPPRLRAELSAALPPAQTTMEQVCRLETGIGHAFAAIAKEANAHLCDGSAELIASHGQTLYHWVDHDRVRATLQVGNPAWIAEATGCPVVSDFRMRDVAAGGNGAPLVSIFDVMWLSGRPGVPAALNLGGIANLTVAGEHPIAFDTGPANALIDAAITHHTDGAQTFDAGGAVAASGRVDPRLLERLLGDPYYARTPPKSTGKELFHLGYLTPILESFPELAYEDLIATLTALTAVTTSRAIRTAAATEVVISGGGTRNTTLMSMIRAELPGIDVASTDDLGVPSAAKEGLAFALLGFLTAHGWPGTVPSCTGARQARVLGSITPGARGIPFSASARGSRPTRLRIDPD